MGIVLVYVLLKNNRTNIGITCDMTEKWPKLEGVQEKWKFFTSTAM